MTTATTTTDTATTVIEWTLPADTEDAMRYRLDKANRKAIKIGQQPYTMTITPAEPIQHSEPDGEIWFEQMITVHVTGDAPRVGNYYVAGNIDLDDVAGPVPSLDNGVLTPDEITAIRLDMECDHCGQNRNRTRVYVLKDASTGRVVQVGTACVELYTGVAISPVDSWHRKMKEDLDAEATGATYGVRAYLVTDVVKLAAHYIDRHGYVSAREAEYERTTSTATLIRSVIDRPTPASRAAMAEQDQATADATIAWAQTLKADTEYGAKVAAIVAQDVCSWSSIGIVASLVISYRRELERRFVEELRRTSKHVGAKDTRYDFGTVRIVDIRVFDNAYGGFSRVKLVDAAGNLIVWKTSTCKFNIGHKANMVAYVKQHSEWQGTKQTDIIRPKFTEA